MRVEVHLDKQAKPIVYEAAENAYVKDGFYVVKNEHATLGMVADKYPIDHIFRVRESYE